MPLRKFKTDSEIQSKFGLTSKKLAELRNDKGLPYINLAKGSNVYNTDSLIKWLMEHETNSPET